MRIKFHKDFEIELDAVPNSAWGFLMKAARPIAANAPQIVDGGFSFPTHAPISHYFPAGRSVELPDDMAAGYVADGVAEKAPFEGGPIEWVEYPIQATGALP